MFIGSLTGLVSASNHKKCVSISNPKCEIQPTFINLHPNEYSQEFHYYPFTVELYKCVGSCNTLIVLSNKVCVPNKSEDLYLNVFNIITGINKSKTLTKHVPCECKCKFDQKNVIQINVETTINVNVSVKNILYVKKDYIWNPSTCIFKNGKYIASIMDDLVIECDEVIEKTVPTNFNEKKINCKTKKFYILIAFLLITSILLTAVSIYCYLIKYQAKQKHLLLFHNTNNELKQKHLLTFHDTKNELKQVLY